MNLPNILTLMRILLIPVFLIIFSTHSPTRSLIAVLVFLIASLTDLLDGYFARRRDQITRLGRLMDPVADKLLISSSLILLVSFERVSPWIAIIIIGREIFITGLRAVISSEGVVISSERLGKYKLTIQIVALSLLILNPDSTYLNFNQIGTILLWISIILSISSGYQYFIKFWR